ncbi:FAD-dependent oxidoreductase [Sphingobacterium hotanense]|uniref:FAD-dependent oxidoreductase n=1 Tax=Sphingobacterium hotanense TaxID=649196 RepID=UPI0021A50471|nr:FAD-dependent oxidoreductase [Sphingobacterium hotanense]MCT1524532.1 FAD-dependent oxidoreductase [Sphingobacterium hotanense]
MFRDGARKSMWQAEIKRYQSVFSTDQNFDVVIVGGGITGISTAYRLQLNGLKCIVLEANNIGFGTTGGTTAHLNDFFDTTFKEAISKFGLENARLLAEAGKEAIHIFQANVSAHDIECDFERKNAELFAIDDKQVEELENIYDGAQQVGYDMSYIESIEFPIRFKKALSIPGQAQFHPLKYVRALADEFIKAGGSIIENCLFESYDETGGEVVIHTRLGDLKTKYAVFATHTPPGISLLHFTTAPYRSYAIGFTLKDDDYPNTLGYDLYDAYHYYRTHVLNGKKIIIAGGEDHKTGHTDDAGACFARLENYCRTYFDVDEIQYAWSSQYFEPADGLPSIGILPSSEGRVFVATGFRGNGMTFGTLSSAIITDIITLGSSKFEKLFNPKRFKPTAGFTSFVKENATVLKDLIGDKISMDRISSLAEIEAGEAKVVRYEGSSYAVYAEQSGQLHILKSTCPHAKCEVRWNNAELSWDCPCHGSRFNVNGKVLTGPSTKGLERIE